MQNATKNYANGKFPTSYRLITSKIYYELFLLDSAQLCLEPLIRTLAEKSPRGKMEILYLQSKICELQGHYKVAHKYSMQALRISDSIYFAEKDRAIPELKAKYRNEQLILRNQYLKKISLYQGYVALTILIAVLSGVIVADKQASAEDSATEAPDQGIQRRHAPAKGRIRNFATQQHKSGRIGCRRRGADAAYRLSETIARHRFQFQTRQG